MEKKLNISLIKELLYLEVKDYYDKTKKQKNIKSDINLLQELITMLESENYKEMNDNYILFDSLIPMFLNTSKEVSQNLSNYLYKAICKINNYLNNPEKYLKSDFERGKKYIKNFVNKLTTTLEGLQAELIFSMPSISEETMNEYKSINHNLKFGKEITSNQYKLLVELFKRKKMEDKDIIILLEKIKNHNIILHINDKRKINYEKLEAVSNIILSGFEQYEDISWLEDERKSQLDKLIDMIIHQGVDEYITPELLPKYQGKLLFSENYSLNCVKYFYTNILKYYQNELLEIYKELNNLENYQNIEYRNMLINLYNEANKNYLLIRKIMDNEITKYNNDLKEISDNDDVKKLYYGVKSSGTTFIESDLKDIPKDTYTSIKDLLMLFRKDKLSNLQLKPIKNSSLSGFLEIKDDQIRIIYRHLKDNEYIVLGVFIKKDDNPINQYKIYLNRKPDSIVDSLSVEEEIFSKLTPHSGGRRNS